MPTISYQPHVPMSPAIRMPSTWRDAIGKPLTDSRIRTYEREGRYGPERQALALWWEQRKNTIHRCPCGQRATTGFLRYKFLPGPGHYCATCLAAHRFARDKEEEQKRAWHARVRQEYI